MKLLELFSGTGSVGKVATFYGFDVVSLDRDMNANIKKQTQTKKQKPEKHIENTNDQ